MVSKAKAVKGSAQAINYILDDKGQAQELGRNLVSGENGEEILAEMREIQEMNARCENNTYSIVLSPSNEREFTNRELYEIGVKHLQNLNFDLNKTQFLMTVHKSTDQPHIHIIANRIGIDGKAHSDNFIGKRAQESAEKIAKSMGLKTAREIQAEKTPDIKTQIRQAYEQSAKKGYTFEDFSKAMNSKGIEVKPTINSRGEMQGMRFLHKSSGTDLKASELGKAFGTRNLIDRGVNLTKMPLPANLAEIAQKAVKIGVQTIDRGRGMSMGF